MLLNEIAVIGISLCILSHHRVGEAIGIPLDVHVHLGLKLGEWTILACLQVMRLVVLRGEHGGVYSTTLRYVTIIHSCLVLLMVILIDYILVSQWPTLWGSTTLRFLVSCGSLALSRT